LHDNPVRRFWFALRATVFCLIAPSRFAELARSHDGHDAFRSEGVATAIRRAFGTSCLLTFGSLATGYLSGRGLRCSVGAASTSVATLVQVISAATVLVATLGVRGWDIQTWTGQLLGEKVNQWVTRSLFVLGTFFFSLFLGWAQ